jgi:hypothetical protein
MSMQIRTSTFGCRAFVLSAVFGAATVMAGAQTAATSAKTTLNLTPPVASEATFSSSAPDNEVAVNAEHFNFTGANAMQYGGRRTGRPRYRGGNTNADGSRKYEFYGGAGFTAPTGDTHHVDTTSWGFQVGAGRNFNKNLGVNVEFNWDNMGLQGSALNNQFNLYNAQINYFCGYSPFTPNSNTTACQSNQITDLTSLDGHTHVWSFGLEPVYNIAVNQGLGAFLEGGFGFYHKVTDFTVPTVEEYCDEFYGCYEVGANQTYDHYTSNAPGVNVGIGFTYKFSRFSNERFYVDARYVYLFNQARSGVDASTCTSPSCVAATFNIANDFPQNSQRTSYIPVKFGIRF